MLSRSVIHRVACAVVAGEIKRLRGPGVLGLLPGDWPETLPLGDEGLGLDSLECLGAIGALAETFHIDGGSMAAEPAQTVSDWIDWIERGRRAVGTLTVMTSGSVGEPRACIHATKDLLDEAAYFAGLLPDRRRIVAMVPANHLYGIIWTALLPTELNIPVITSSIGVSLHLEPGDLVVAVPEQWQALLRLTRRFPADVYGVSSAGMLANDVANRLLTAGVARMIDVYGSSETGAIAMRDPPEPSYELLPRWNLVADRDDWLLVDQHARHVQPPDHVEQTGPRRLRPIGRRDNAVQVAGRNVWPERVATELRRCQGVAEVAVRLGENGRLKAYIVPLPGAEPDSLSDALARIAAARLSDVERPKAFSFGPALPRNEMGKLTGWA